MAMNKDAINPITIDEILNSCHTLTREDFEEAKRLADKIMDYRIYFINTKHELARILETSFHNISKTLPFKITDEWQIITIEPETKKPIPKKSIRVYKEIEADIKKVLNYSQSHWATYNCITGEESYIDYDVTIVERSMSQYDSSDNMITVLWDWKLISYVFADTKNMLKALKRVTEMLAETKAEIDRNMTKIKDVLIIYQ